MGLNRHALRALRSDYYLTEPGRIAGNSALVTRRALLGWGASTSALAFAGPLSRLDTGGLHFRRSGRRIALWNGRTRVWEVDPTPFGGILEYGSDAGVAWLRLTKGCFPCSNLPIEFHLQVSLDRGDILVNTTGPWGLSGGARLDAWIAGTPITSECESTLPQDTRLAGLPLMLSGRGKVELDSSLGITLTSVEPSALSFDNGLLAGRSVRLGALNGETPSLLENAPSHRTEVCFSDITECGGLDSEVRGSRAHALLDLSTVRHARFEACEKDKWSYQVVVPHGDGHILNVQDADMLRLPLTGVSLCACSEQCGGDRALVADVADGVHGRVKVGDWHYHVGGDGGAENGVLLHVQDGRELEFSCETVVHGADLPFGGAYPIKTELHSKHFLDVGGTQVDQKPKLRKSTSTVPLSQPGAFSIHVRRPSDNLVLEIAFGGVSLEGNRVRSNGTNGRVALILPPQHLEEAAVWEKEWLGKANESSSLPDGYSISKSGLASLLADVLKTVPDSGTDSVRRIGPNRRVRSVRALRRIHRDRWNYSQRTRRHRRLA